MIRYRYILAKIDCVNNGFYNALWTFEYPIKVHFIIQKLYITLEPYSFIPSVFQEMLYGISTGFGSPQVPVAEILARAVPVLPSPQKPKSSNFLQVPDIETPRYEDR